MKRFDTVLEESVYELIVQKSRFITYLIPVRNEEAAVENLERIRKAHWDATHHVPAWVLDSGAQKFSDDGEPGGTAGLPVLEALKHGNMKNCMLVVVRYFGGTKLGTGGLVRAYGQAARAVLSGATIYTVAEFDRIRVDMEYTQIGRVQAYLAQSGAIGIETAFAENVELQFFIEPENADALVDQLIDLTNGSVGIKHLEAERLAVSGSGFIRYHTEGMHEGIGQESS